MERKRVLFVCTHNSARSQMAEGFLRAWGGDTFEVHSAGTQATEVRPEAIQVMADIGIDISGQHSKTIDRYLGQAFDWVVTVCDRARQECPTFPGAKHTGHWGFEDPSEVEGPERLEAFKRSRDEIGARLRVFLLAAGRDDLPRPTARLV